MTPILPLQHAIAADALRTLRDKQTTPCRFREAVRRLTTLLVAEATRSLETEPVDIQTPIQSTTAYELRSRIGIVPILRAGLSMVDPFLDLLPHAEVWHLGFYRDERTLQPVAYYQKLPAGRPVDVAFVLDPMLATGGSAIAALKDLKAWGVKQTCFLGLLAAPEGIERVQQTFPGTRILVCAIDERLNEQGYIVPGLGDAGDRAFNAAAN
ncbi:MAG: uracil phosphoribosyltransferase [Verrucomicrobia bacterium]|nr:uracil phosphoribosyltransferase [Verrucomicrobiota bacterium]MCH8526871.1 uracil phosphoribosyltransferase [Kiritimatiellia bacterium]